MALAGGSERGDHRGRGCDLPIPADRIGWSADICQCAVTRASPDLAQPEPGLWPWCRSQPHALRPFRRRVTPVSPTQQLGHELWRQAVRFVQVRQLLLAKLPARLELCDYLSPAGQQLREPAL